MTVIVKHNKTNTITDWTQAQLDEQIALGNFAPGTTLANIVLPSDWNNDHTLTGLGTMAEQDATAVAITGGTINNTTIGATTATTGKFTSVTTPSVTATTLDLALNSVSTGSVNFSSAGGQLFKISDGGAYGGYWNAFSASGSPSLRAIGNVSGAIDTNSAVPIQFRTNLGSSGAEQFRVGHTASAVNYVQVTGAATTIQPIISAQGSDGNIALNLRSKGTSGIWFGSSDGAIQFQVTPTTSAVNNLRATGSIAGNALPFVAGGSDTNISMAFQPKGTGAIDLAAGSSGVNISNGGTVTAITRTSSGSAYTSNPTVAITAPTTAGGVQATATCTLGVASYVVAGGGTGYAVGNVLTMVGGTFTSAGTCTVSAVSSGVITAVTATTGGAYTVAPTNPVSVTGGAGTGATFTLSFGVNTTFTITNAGSGYIEQPTITFSGGGGSGAAAYAVIGNTTITRGLASVSTFHSPSGETLRLSESGGTSVASVNITNGSSSQNTVYLTAYGSATNPNLYLASKGTGNIIFATNTNNTATGTQQAQISHTASAVNYVQVTGGITSTGIPRISAQGSDATASIALTAKSATIWLESVSGFAQAAVTHTASANNYLTFTGGNNASPNIGVASASNANIDLALTPKGTGLVRFGTYVAGALLATGYINIKAADGTTYKVLVST
jgi:hypothetical protein